MEKEKKQRKKPVRVIPVALRNECAKFIEAMEWKATPFRSGKQDVYVTAVYRGTYVFFVWFGDKEKEPARFKASQDFMGSDYVLHPVKDVKECLNVLRKHDLEIAKLYPESVE